MYHSNRNGGIAFQALSRSHGNPESLTPNLQALNPTPRPQTPDPVTVLPTPQTLSPQT